MESNLKSLGYTITSDPNYFDSENKITPEARPYLEESYEISCSPEKSGIAKIQALVEKFPDCPQFMNYLSTAYTNIGETEKAREVNRKIIDKHPNYLFAKLNLAAEYLDKNEFDKVPKVLGGDMELKSLYPNRNVFHITEVTSFLKFAVHYYAHTNNPEQAINRFELMMKVDPDSNMAEDTYLFLLERDILSFEDDDSFPTFHHHQIDELYLVGLRIKKESLDSILALPRETLITDLELVLQDSIERIDWFKEEVEIYENHEEGTSFVMHALFLLGQLEAEESLPAILNVLRQDEDYLEFYLGDLLTELIWEPLFKVAENQLDVLKEFMFEPSIYVYSKTGVAETAKQIAFHKPDRRSEIIDWFQDVFEFYESCGIESDKFDPDLIGSLICEVIEIEAKELLTHIKKMYDLGFVNLSYCGSYLSVQEDMLKSSPINKKHEVLPIAERYQEITSTWASYQNESNDSSSHFLDTLNLLQDTYSADSEPAETYVREERKIGRNEPCPCGSGKKYKKCCLMNLD